MQKSEPGPLEQVLNGAMGVSPLTCDHFVLHQPAAPYGSLPLILPSFIDGGGRAAPCQLLMPDFD